MLAAMWIRKRLDISSKDILAAMLDCLEPGSLAPVKEKIAALWEKRGEKALVCFSVRTGLDALLKVLNFERGSDILMSALTIPDMPRIVRCHGCTPVPIDIEDESLAPSADSIESAVTEKTRAIIVAHLFGNIINLEEISKIARAHGLILIEDCAQSYHGRSYTGSDLADISMFSFGTIKTATALGGAIFVVRNNDRLAGKMDALQASYPVQRKASYFKKLAKYLFLKLLFPRAIFRTVVALSKKTSIDYDALIHGLSRSFPGEDLLSKIRMQPSLPLLKLMLHRFETFSEAATREHIRRGCYLLQNLPETCRFPGGNSEKHTFWVFPVMHDHPDHLIRRMRISGFDATRRHSLQVVESAEGKQNNEMPNCRRIESQIVYLPLYRQIPEAEIDRMVGCMKINRT
jgi:perosamine synthetase